MANYTSGDARRLSNAMGRQTRKEKQEAAERERRFNEWRLRRAALAKFHLTSEEKARWKEMLVDTWQAIGFDVESAMRAEGQRLTRAIIVEVVCDANHLEMYGGMTRDEYEFLGVVYGRRSTQTWLRQVLNY